ncbi:MAG: glucose-1-phosphate thymidylyltransferase [Elusimicrobia bacterium]|nr:glucose-1-phosphate thymidylyltransferase [Elusimicrobiota bacterium]MBD3412260.1 glucose-1-phosphate thymidylyltransferase [Elusimicrobiota bacterium]
MKGLILTGGKGTRLRPITHTFAKQLIPIANKPVLYYGIESLAACGVTDIGFVVGDTKDEIKKAVGDGSRWGIKPTFIEQEQPLGLAHAVMISEPFIGTDSFIMYLGDNLILSGIKQFVDLFVKNKPNAHIMLARVPSPQQFGVAEISGNKVVRLVEKPKQPKSDLALVGVYLFDNNIFPAVKSLKPSARGELEITEAIQYLLDHKKNIEYSEVQGWWKDTGKLEDLLEANRTLLDQIQEHWQGSFDKKSKIEGKVIIEDNAKIIRSTVRGPVVIGKDSVIEDSYIGPFTSIYYNVRIRHSEIEHSVVLENSIIDDVKRIEDSLIGQRVEIKRSQTKPKAYRITVGDSSRVEII